jgi:regulator of protease activity HflC (stomatin/prohibitin superfamily)
MADVPVKIVVDLSKPKGERESIIPLTKAEITERDAQAVIAEAERVEQEAIAQALTDLKSSAKAKHLMWLEFLQLANWDTRDPIFTLNDFELGKLSIHNRLA